MRPKPLPAGEVVRGQETRRSASGCDIGLSLVAHDQRQDSAQAELQTVRKQRVMADLDERPSCRSEKGLRPTDEFDLPDRQEAQTA